MKLNLGCGSNKIPDCINIDVEPSCEPDLVHNFLTTSLPYKDNSVDEIYLFHTIEHIQEKYQPSFLREIHRVLVMGGSFFVSYPEFTICASNYINNYQGQREFWKATIYGRQLYLSDTHVTLMDSKFFVPFLEEIGFKCIARAEPGEPHNSFVKCTKVEIPMGRDELYNHLLFSSAAAILKV